MIRWLAAMTVCGALLTVCGWIYGVFTVGVPYPDPTPAQAAAEKSNLAISSRGMGLGLGVFGMGLVLLLLSWIVRVIGRSRLPRASRDLSVKTLLVLSCGLGLGRESAQAIDRPQATDPRLVLELFAREPQIVTPTGIAVDANGLVFVVESHTHFRPQDYEGPPSDRILVFEHSKGEGHAERKSIFHQGFAQVMDLEFHPDGSLYVATRRDIHRMRDLDGDFRADEVVPVVRLETTGDYPHNGLSGLAFDFQGGLHFGLGENLGHAYVLSDTEGTRISGGAEGGSTYHVLPDGSGLRRVSTGYWNPFGMCVDAFGRVFATDNDPDASPPCRLIQVIEGGDYGYEFRYGRSGLHPLITWTGELPGTLPMVTGTGEAPCAVVAYESDALPEEYRGQLLVASWSDRRLEHYPIAQRADRVLVESSRNILAQGGDSFRPVDLAVAPDGTVFVSDWASTSYPLHKKGRIWRLRSTGDAAREPIAEPSLALRSNDRRERERAARLLAETPAGKKELHTQLLQHPSSRVRVAALQALIGAGDPETPYVEVARKDGDLAVRALAVRGLLKPGGDPLPWSGADVPAVVRFEAASRLELPKHRRALLEILREADPLLAHAGTLALAKALSADPGRFQEIAREHARGALLALRRVRGSPQAFSEFELERFLSHQDPDVLFCVIKWIADHQLTEQRPAMEALLGDQRVDQRLFRAVCATLDRLDGKTPSDRPSAEFLLVKIRDRTAPSSLRRLALQLIEPAHSGLALQDLKPLLAHGDVSLRQEAVRTLSELSDRRREGELVSLIRDADQPWSVRALAVLGLVPVAHEHTELMLQLALGENPHLRDEALRALTGVELSVAARAELARLGRAESAVSEAVRRIQAGAPDERPAKEDTPAWLALLGREGDARAGERVFYNGKLGTCSRCHQVNGRGGAVGPDLTAIHRRFDVASDDGRRLLLESILQPSRNMAPHYTPWVVVTRDGKTRVGLPLRKGDGMEAYLDGDGREFIVRDDNLLFHQESSTSIMPEDLLAALTRKELADLFAYLLQPRR